MICSLSPRTATTAGRRPARFAFYAIALYAVTGALGWLVAGQGGAAQAQSRDMQQMIDRMDRLERELATVQRNAYGRPPGPAAGGAAYAAAPAGGGGSGAAIARMDVRLSEMEGILASITGRLEELTFQNQSLQNRLDKLVGDVDFRLRTLEGGGQRPQGEQGGAPAAPPPAAALPSATQAPAPLSPQAPPANVAQTLAGRSSLTLPPAAPQGAAPPQAAGAPPPPPPPAPGTLGTLSQADVAALAAAQRASAGGGAVAAPGQPQANTQTAAAPAARGAVLPPGSAKDQYEFAYNLLRQRNYPEAEQAFREFVSRHKADELSGNALYWLGETHYVRRQFEPAAIAFLEGYNNYPKGSKAADNLLKLGMSLAGLNRQKEACTTLAKLNKEFPDAPANLKAVADNERRKISCRA